MMKKCLIQLTDTIPDFAADVDLLVVKDNLDLSTLPRLKRSCKVLRWVDLGSARMDTSSVSTLEREQTRYVKAADAWLRDMHGNPVLYWDAGGVKKYLVDIRDPRYLSAFAQLVQQVARDVDGVLVDNAWDGAPTWHDGVPYMAETNWLGANQGAMSMIAGRFAHQKLIITNGGTYPMFSSGRLFENAHHKADLRNRVERYPGLKIVHGPVGTIGMIQETLLGINYYLAPTDQEGRWEMTEDSW